MIRREQVHLIIAYINCSWVATLPQSLKDHHLEDISVFRLHEHRCHLRTWMEMKSVAEKGEKLKQLAKAVYSEV